MVETANEMGAYLVNADRMSRMQRLYQNATTEAPHLEESESVQVTCASKVEGREGYNQDDHRAQALKLELKLFPYISRGSVYSARTYYKKVN